jgi:hypothetical protein
MQAPRSSDCPMDDAAISEQGGQGKQRVCTWCGEASPALRRCGRCKAAWYCGAEHQRADWKAGHKHKCDLVYITGTY